MAEKSKEEMPKKAQSTLVIFSIVSMVVLLTGLLSSIFDDKSIEVAIFCSAFPIVLVLSLGFNALIKAIEAKE